MDQQSVIADIEDRARRAGVSIRVVCERAGVHPTTFSRWKLTELNPEPAGASLISIGKIYSALEEIVAERRRARKAVAA